MEKWDVLSGEGSRSEKVTGRQNVGDLKMGPVGSKGWKVWQDEEEGVFFFFVVMGQEPDAPVSLTEMEVKCSFMWRQHRERGRHKEKNGGEGAAMMTLTSAEGRGFWEHGVESL